MYRSVAEKHQLRARPVMHHVHRFARNGEYSGKKLPSRLLYIVLSYAGSGQNRRGNPSLSASLCKPFRRAVGIGHWHRYIQVPRAIVHIYFPYIYYIDIYKISPRSWLGTINPPRRDVIAIFGPLIGSLHGRIRGDDTTWRHNHGEIDYCATDDCAICTLVKIVQSLINDRNISLSLYFFF